MLRSTAATITNVSVLITDGTAVLSGGLKWISKC